jgi:CRISPR system Cascade subunit CasC
MEESVMDRFVQLHFLTAYPPANLNRDDLGRPKTARMGGAERLRVSSQSLKRAWRTSDVFAEALAEHVGTRTKRMGERVFQRLTEKGVKDKDALQWAADIAKQFGKPVESKPEEPKDLYIEQLAHFSPSEIEAINALADKAAERGKGPEDDELKALHQHSSAADIAMFGRMLAAAPAFNVEAAAQVGHAITVHKVAVEDDFYTAVDDLNLRDEDAGAGHMGVTEFGAGLFYLYVCIDRALLLKNLKGDRDLATKALAALTEAVATVAPTGKQASFGSRARAVYGLAERGNAQPRSLAGAFLNAVDGKDYLEESIGRLEDTVDAFAKVYEDGAAEKASFNVPKGEGRLADLITCATEWQDA